MLVGFAVLEAPFGFLEVQVEGVPKQALEHCQTDLCQAPEAFDAVDVNGAVGELVLGMIDAEVTVTEIDQPLQPRQLSELITVVGSAGRG